MGARRCQSPRGVSAVRGSLSPAVVLELDSSDDRVAYADALTARGLTVLAGEREDAIVVRRDERAITVSWSARYPAERLSPTIAASDLATFVRLAADKHTSDEALRASGRERATLLREVHHRVNNNFQIVTSLLALHRDAEPHLVEAFEKARRRIFAMAAVHAHLYRLDTLASLDFASHLPDLVESIVHGESRRATLVDYDIEPVWLDLPTAVPLALIAHELVTNAVQHACAPAGGRITVGCASRDGRVVLSVGDEGPGVPADCDVASCCTVGARLVRALAKQLDATVEVRSSGGTTVTVTVAAPSTTAARAPAPHGPAAEGAP